jgi:hypothetical protein
MARLPAIAALSLVTALGLVGLVGVAHLPFARGLLMRAGGCPMAGNRATVGEIETLRRSAMAAERGTADAPARPALGFELDRTTHADVLRWSQRNGVACTDVREGLVHCTQVPAQALGADPLAPAVAELSLGFDTQARLVNLTTLRVRLTSDGATSALGDITGRLRSQIGPPQGGSIDPVDPARLARSGAESLTQVQYRYRDYFAEVVAMRVPWDGLMLREHYMSARD